MTYFVCISTGTHEQSFCVSVGIIGILGTVPVGVCGGGCVLEDIGRLVWFRLFFGSFKQVEGLFEAFPGYHFQ